MVALATACTGVVGGSVTILIERAMLQGSSGADIEQLFGNTSLIAAALAVVGLMIVLSEWRASATAQRQSLQSMDAIWIGAVQGFCLPFRGFSRSGATISTGMFRGLHKELLENFSFALAVVLTPAVIAREGYRLLRGHDDLAVVAGDSLGILWPSLAGMILSVVSGWISLKWLSRWLEHGRWHLFGYYCLCAALSVVAAGKFFA